MEENVKRLRLSDVEYAQLKSVRETIKKLVETDNLHDNFRKALFDCLMSVQQVMFIDYVSSIDEPAA